MRLPGSEQSTHVDHTARNLLPELSDWPHFDYSAEHLREYPDFINAAESLIDDAIQEGYGEKVALIFEDSKWTYAQLQEKASQIAHVLVDDYGLVAGNRVLLRSPNNPMLAACWLGVLKAGGICVASMALLRAKELAFIGNHVKIDFALCDIELSEELELALPQISSIRRVGYFTALGEHSHTQANLDAELKGKSPFFPAVKTAADDIALVTFTSGTTGNPKAVAQFHRNIIATCDSVPLIYTVEPDDVVCAASSMAFTYGLSSLLLYPLYYRATAIIVTKPTSEAILSAVEKYRANSLFAVPTLYNAMLDELDKYDVSSLTKCSSAGENIKLTLWEAWQEKTGIQIVNGIGATEFMSHFLSDSLDVDKPTSCGKAIPGYKVAILDDAGNELPPGNRGMIAVKGPTGCLYLNDPDRQRIYVRNGWNITNDVFELDEDGYFWFVDRADDLIVSSGYNISPQEVEIAVMEHPEVREAAVVGVPDTKRGNVAMACVVLQQGCEPSETLAKSIQSFVKERVAPYKYPRILEFYSDLPRTGTGKLQRFKIKQEYLEKLR